MRKNVFYSTNSGQLGKSFGVPHKEEVRLPRAWKYRWAAGNERVTIIQSCIGCSCCSDPYVNRAYFKRFSEDGTMIENRMVTLDFCKNWFFKHFGTVVEDKDKWPIAVYEDKSSPHWVRPASWR